MPTTHADRLVLTDDEVARCEKSGASWRRAAHHVPDPDARGGGHRLDDAHRSRGQEMMLRGFDPKGKTTSGIAS